MIIELDGIKVELIRKAVKHVNLRVYPPDGLVKISAPLKFSERMLRQILKQKITWIHQQRERILNRVTIEHQGLETGITIPFKGKNYLLLITEHNGPSHIEIKDELILCYTQPQSSQEQRQVLVDKWYHQQMATLLPDLIQHWEKIIGVKVAQWGIRKMKTRWGSCATQKARISLNLNLIKKPQECLEYVLVHELIHLLEPSHNQRFYKLMSSFMPQWRDYKQLLEEHSSC